MPILKSQNEQLRNNFDHIFDKHDSQAQELKLAKEKAAEKDAKIKKLEDDMEGVRMEFMPEVEKIEKIEGKVKSVEAYVKELEEKLKNKE